MPCRDSSGGEQESGAFRGEDGKSRNILFLVAGIRRTGGSAPDDLPDPWNLLPLSPFHAPLQAGERSNVVLNSNRGHD